jgi:hypothetical protein
MLKGESIMTANQTQNMKGQGLKAFKIGSVCILTYVINYYIRNILGVLTPDMVAEGAVVIDVGVNRDPETGKLCGDVDYAAIEPKASVITPVPGGVGPMTICCLMENTIECFLRKMNA